MSQLNHYAIICAANEPDLSTKLAELDPPHACLYTDPVDPEIAALAPYLVTATPDVKLWLANNTKPWGIFLTSEANLKAVRQHLRKYLRILLPDDDVPAMNFFYDPRVIWDFFSILEDWQLHSFMGPIESIKTNWQGEEIEKDFADVRSQFVPGQYSKERILRLSLAQLNRMDQIQASTLANKVAARMQDWFESSKQAQPAQQPIYTVRPHDEDEPLHEIVETKPDPDFKQVASQLIDYLQANDITDKQAVYGLAKLFVASNCYALTNFKDQFGAILENPDDPGFFKAETALLQAFGKLPRFEEKF